MAAQDGKPQVIIVGAGIAGLTAALRLAERGFQVTIYEKGAFPGGNLGGTRVNGETLEVYPHMFGQWYNNFWQLITDIDISREQTFEQRPVCGFLEVGDFPHYRPLINNGSWSTAVQNLFSGILSPPNMFLAGYTILDLLTQNLEGNGIMAAQTLNGFVVTRPYASEAVARYFDSLDNNIWSVDSYRSSAYSFQRFAQYQFREPSPQAWVIKSNSYDGIIKPLCDLLQGKWHCTIKCNTTVHGVTVDRNRVTQISYSGPGDQHPHVEDLTNENLILAVSPLELARLVMTPASAIDAALRRDNRPGPIVRHLPELATVRSMASMPIPVLYVTLNRTLSDIPPYYVALVGSQYSLTFVRHEYLSAKHGKMVLALAASDFQSLPVDPEGGLKSGVNPGDNPGHEAAFIMLGEFARYVPIKIGRFWGDPDSDIDWERTCLESNESQQLFLNEPSTRIVRPVPNPEEVENLFFAGGLCSNPITIATVEASVYTGLIAAQAVWHQHDPLAAYRNPITATEPKSYPTALVAALLVLLAPSAVVAKYLSVLEDLAGRLSNRGSPGSRSLSAFPAASIMAQGATVAARAYAQASIRTWQVMLSVAGRMLR